MNTDAKFLELPLKYAFIATAVFTVSAFILGYLYEFLALTAFNLHDTKGEWPAMREISGLSFARVLRYFVFYFLIFLSLISYMRSSAKSSPWGLLILFVIIPLAAGIILFLFASFAAGRPQLSSFWPMQAILIVIMFLGIGFTSGTPYQRAFFIGFLFFIIMFPVQSDINSWGEAVNAMGKNYYYSHKATDIKIGYFIPAALLSAAVNFYLFYMIPRNFLKELNEQES